MARLFYGTGRGFKSKYGFTFDEVTKSYNAEFVRPPFSVNGSQFIRETSAVTDTPMPFGNEGTYDIILEAATAADASDFAWTPVGTVLEAATATDTVDATMDLRVNVEGFLPRLMGSASVSSELQINAQGILPRLMGEVTTGLHLEAVLPRLMGSASISSEMWVRASGKLPKLLGLAQVSSELGIEVEGILPKLLGSVEVFTENKVSVSGILPKLKASGVIFIGNHVSVAGILPSLMASAELSHDVYITVAGILPGLSGSAKLTNSAATAAFTVLAMNLENKALSTYSNYNFESLVYHNGKYYGFNSTGIHELTGDTDLVGGVATPILGEIETGIVDTAAQGVKTRLAEAWLNYRATTSGVEVSIKEDEGTVYACADIPATGNVAQDARAKFPRGIKGRFYSLKIKGKGGKFNVGSARMMNEAIPKRTR